MMNANSIRTTLALTGLLLMGTTALFAQDKKDLPPSTGKLEAYECGKVQRMHTLDGVFLASQPQPEDFQMAKDGGIRTVVNLRFPNELDWNEAALIDELKMEYHSIPFRAPDSLTDDVFEKARGLLQDKQQRPLLLHCASANRVGAVWLAHRVLDGGLSYDDALAEARTVGLRLPAYEQKARNYIDRNRSGDVVRKKEHGLPDASTRLEPYACGTVKRIHTLGGVFLASQPQADDLKMAREGGIRTVVNLRFPDELEWDEAALVKELQMEYHSIPFKNPDSLTDEVFAKVRSLLRDKQRRPLLLHCSSANRVGAVWLAHRVLDGGLGYQEALAEARTVGLKLPAYEQKTRDYIERVNKR